MGKVGKKVGTRRFISIACLGSLGKHDHDQNGSGSYKRTNNCPIVRLTLIPVERKPIFQGLRIPFIFFVSRHFHIS